MNKLLLNNQELDVSSLALPVLIHGEDKLGASFYTITLAANLSRYYPILFLCGYKHAHEEFIKQAGDAGNVTLLVKEQLEEFKSILQNATNDLVVILKNIELFDETIYSLISDRNNLIVSGDINKSSIRDKIQNKDFKTKIYFSKLSDSSIPELEKYTGYFKSLHNEGITSIRI